MVQVNITTPFNAGLNAANEAAGGVLEQRQRDIQNGMAREQLDMARQSQQFRQQMAEEQMAQRRTEIERLSQERQGRSAAISDYLGRRGRQFKPTPPGVPTGSGAFFGQPFTSSRENPNEMEELEGYLGEQRAAVDAFASTLSPEARNSFYETSLPLLMEDEQNELNGVAIRATRRRLQEVAGSEFLDEEERQIAQMAMQGLETGAEDVQSVSAMLRELKRSATRRLTRQQNFQWGQQWGQQQIQEAALGGADVAGLHSTFADWLVSDDLDPKKLQKAMLEKRYNLKVGTRRIGKSEVDENIDPESWRQLAMMDAEDEAMSDLAKDPEASRFIKEGFLTDEDRSKFDRLKRQYTQRALKKYALQWGVDPDSLILSVEPENPVDKRKQVEDALRAAGVDLDAVRAPMERGGIKMPNPDKMNAKMPRDMTGEYAKTRALRDEVRNMPKDPNDDVYGEEDFAELPK